MKIKVLGAHNLETRQSRCTSLVIDDVLAIDAGALTASLSAQQQQRLKAVLLTHQHYDHMRDIPALGMGLLLHGNSIDIYGSRQALDALSAHLLNDIIYPNFLIKPKEKPALRFTELEAGKTREIAGYAVLPVPVRHAVPTMGYEITSATGRKVFFTADTGPGLEEVWCKVSPHLLIAELTAPDRYRDFALQAGHLTPALLEKELELFRRIKGYLPRVALVHMNYLDEKEIRREIAAIARRLEVSIRLARGGMVLEV